MSSLDTMLEVLGHFLRSKCHTLSLHHRLANHFQLSLHLFPWLLLGFCQISNHHLSPQPAGISTPNVCFEFSLLCLKGSSQNEPTQAEETIFPKKADLNTIITWLHL